MPDEVATPQSNGIDIYDTAVMEPIITAKARKLAREWRYRDDNFSIHLVKRLKGGYSMSLIAGSPVRIELLWPAIVGEFNSAMRSAFATIKKHGLHQPFAVATHAYFAREHGVAKKWTRAKLGADLADTLESLIPKHRLVTITTTTTQVIDTVTGTVIEKTVSTKGDHRDAPFAMWSEISQIIFDKHPETIDFVETFEAPPETVAVNDDESESVPHADEN